ncbi:MAG: hypothetical protein IH831_09945 [Planctomycetes bacterium]|nr:hypothetical protein [Planctomycetota bacterium]
MNTECLSRQLHLFPGDRVPWETLPEECQQSAQELLSLLIEQVVLWRLQHTQTSNEGDENHV